MSVINQMLKDLDKRQQTNPQSMSPLVDDSGRSLRAYLLMAVVLLALSVSAWLALRYFQSIHIDSDVKVLTEADSSEPQSSVTPSVEEPNLQTVASAMAVTLPIVEKGPSIAAETPSLLVAPGEVMPLKPMIKAASLKTSAVVQPAGQSQSVAPEVGQETSAAIPRKSVEKFAPRSVAALDDPHKTQVQAKPLDTASTTASLQITPITLSLEQRVDLYTRRAMEALDNKRLEQARSEFSKALQLDPRAHSVREQLAALQFGRGDVSRAVGLLEAGIQLSPQHSGFRLMLARIFVQQQNWQQALFYLDAQRPEVAGNVDYYAMLASLAQRLNKTELAFDSYRLLLKQQPSRARWWLGYAIANDKLGHYKEALAAYHQAEQMGQLSSQTGDFVTSRIRQLEQ
ncbi:tetratricopeptide repeat protein [Agarivorans sp. QJM3NY_29]|uniref:tetratricopeptide repeat protein n=1 Tax=unclassified Agarivorans TaxID=2636026 RepID=UPI003D7E9F10